MQQNDSNDRKRVIQLKMSFDGCGVVNGCMGLLFAAGLRDQVSIVVERIRQILSHGLRMRLVSFGLSRGAIATMYLVQVQCYFRQYMSISCQYT